jgi:hypothetical protein
MARQKVLSVAAARAAALDRDVLTLDSATSDDMVFELITSGESCKLSAALLFFACQGVLFGLSLLNAALVLASRAQTHEADNSYRRYEDSGAQVLADGLLALEPYLTGFTTTFAQIACIGSLSRSYHARERANAAGVPESCLPDGDQTASEGDEQTVRQEALRQASLCGIASIANMAALLSCLVGSANATALSFYGSPAASDTGITGFGADMAKWHVTAARLSLGLRAGFGMFAMIPMLMDAQYLIAPTIPGIAFAQATADMPREQRKVPVVERIAEASEENTSPAVSPGLSPGSLWNQLEHESPFGVSP